LTALQAGGRLSHRTLFLTALLLNYVVVLSLLGDGRLPRGQATREFIDRHHQLLAGQEGPPAGPGGLLLILLRPLGPWLGSLPFLPLFHLSMVLDELIFLLGVWLLARRFSPSPVAVFFVTVAAAGSTLWTDHVHANFFAFHSVPLALVLIHEFLDSGTRRNLFFALLLLALQGTLSSALAVLLYFVSWTLLSSRDVVARLRALRREPRDGLWILAMLAAGSLALLRVPAPAVDPRPAGDIVDLLLGAALSPNVTVYCGFFTIALAAHALDRRRLLLLAPALGSFVLLSLAGPALPFAKLFVVFLAGLGVEKLLREPKGATAPAIGLMLLAIGLTALTLLSLNSPDLVEDALRPVLGTPPGRLDTTYPRDLRFLHDLFGVGAFACGAAAAVLFLFRAGPRTRPLALALLLLLHPMDVYGWKSRMFWFRTTAQTARLPRIEEPPDGARGIPSVPRSSLLWSLASAAAGAGSLLWLGLLSRGILRELRRRSGEAA